MKTVAMLVTFCSVLLATQVDEAMPKRTVACTMPESIAIDAPTATEMKPAFSYYPPGE